MILSEEARAIRKQSQLARLKAKQDDPDGYPDFYANQPVQKAKAEMNAKITAARQLIRVSREALDIARASGEGIEAAENALDIASAALNALLAQKQARFKPNLPANISGGAS